jgi:hypothetical protein
LCVLEKILWFVNGLVAKKKATEACRYLCDSKRWEDAIRLAKLSPVMSEHDKLDLFRKWCDHLSNVQKNWKDACLVWLSMGSVSRAASLLHGNDRFQIAVGLLKHFADLKEADVDEHVAQGMHLDYGFFLHRLGLERDAAEQFSLAGSAGAQMMEALVAAPFELRGTSRGRSGSGVVSAGKKGMLGRVAENLKEEIATLTKKNDKKK